MTENKNATMREYFNAINVYETFTSKYLSEVSEVPMEDVTKYVYLARKKGYCAVHKSDGKKTIYKKMKDDDRKSRIKRKSKPKPPIKSVKLPSDLEITLSGTDEEIIEKLVPFTNKLKQRVISLTERVNTLQEENKSLLSDNDTLRTEVDDFHRLVPRLQEEVAKFRKMKAVRTIKI